MFILCRKKHAIQWGFGPSSLPCCEVSVYQDEVAESSDAVQEPRRKTRRGGQSLLLSTYMGATFDTVTATSDFSTGCHRLLLFIYVSLCTRRRPVGLQCSVAAP